MQPSSDDSRWNAGRLRTSSAHAAFVYAVKTTRIFCRPTCPARLARQSNVVFFDAAAAAESAGFRACKRCKPDSQDLPTRNDRRREMVDQACGILRLQGDKAVPAEVARQLGLSWRYFHGVFKEHVGLTPTQYARQHSEVGDGGSHPATAPTGLTNGSGLSYNAASDGLILEQPEAVCCLQNPEYAVAGTDLNDLGLPELATDSVSSGGTATEELIAATAGETPSIDALVAIYQAERDIIDLPSADIDLEEAVPSQEWMSWCWMNTASEEHMVT